MSLSARPSARPAGKRVLIVDDHPVVLFGLRFLFEQDQQFDVCGEAGDAATARAETARLLPDFVVLDLVLGGEDGVPMIQDLIALHPGVAILVYSSHEERLFAPRILRAGARGFVPKSEGLPVVADALRVIAAGRTYVSRTFSEQAPDDLVERGSPPTRRVELSDRELEVLRLIGNGAGSREVAERLQLSIKTVGTYRERIKLKLGLASGRDLDRAAVDYVEGRRGGAPTR